MNKSEQSLYYFALGEFIARTMLQGIIHPDMQRRNIGFGDGNFKFLDYADVHKISMPEELTDITFHQLTEALFSALDDIPDDFMIRSYFRAGFTSYGGVLTHAIFSNAVNSGFSSFLYTSKDAVDATFNATAIYSDKNSATTISEWKSCPLDRVTLRNYTGLAAYNESTERQCLSHFNMYYLDNLYFVRSYLGLSNMNGVESQLPILLLNMAVSAHHFGLPYTAYGLYQKCLSMTSDIAEVNATCHKGLKELRAVIASTPGIADYIGCCVDYGLFELSWILNDLDYTLPQEVDLQIEISTSGDDAIFMPNMAPVIMGADGVAPDLANLLNGDIYLMERVLLEGEPTDGIFGTYIEKAVEFYSTVKTLLYSETPRPFCSIYVPNDIKAKYVGAGSNFQRVDTPIVDLIGNPFNDLIIKGTGGIGKSMMMRHIFLHFAEEYVDHKLLPILVPLKNFTANESNLESFIYRSVYEFDHDVGFDDFEPMLKNGSCLILLDGYDEVPTAARNTFEAMIVSFRKSYHKNKIIVSSRPTTSFVQFGSFQVLEIEPFSKEKALELIDKLDYHDAEAKAKFRKDLSGRLYYSHQQFASNPLLLTIMLMTYTSYGEVPAKRHIFYAKAYETMARLHDASKGAYVRPMHTGLTPEDFATYFAEFCARTYKAEVLEFDERIFTGYMEQVIRHQKRKIEATPRDFLVDLTDNLCIMYKEGEKYYFIHRSFQEYFCAVFFSNQMDDRLWEIGQSFENQKKRMMGDMTFAMLYDMIPSRVDRYIFLPYLTKLWEECDASDGYWTFLENMYPTIYAQEGEAGDNYTNDSDCFLYEYITLVSCHHHGELYSLKWPSGIDDFDRTEWTSIRTQEYMRDGQRYVSTEVVEFDSVDVDDDYIEEYGEPEVEGISWEIDISDLRKQAKAYAELCSFMESDDFPLKQEYNEMRALTALLDRTYNTKPSSDDWFDSF